MATNNFKDKGSIIKFGGGILKVREVADDGAYTTGDLTDLGYINDCGLRFETEIEDIPDETGQTVTSLEGNDTVMLEGMFMQSGKDLLDFIRDETIGKYYQIYYKATPTAALNGLTQELFVGISRLKRQIDIATPNSVYGSVTTPTVNILAEKYYEITEA